MKKLLLKVDLSTVRFVVNLLIVVHVFIFHFVKSSLKELENKSDTDNITLFILRVIKQYDNNVKLTIDTLFILRYIN